MEELEKKAKCYELICEIMKIQHDLQKAQADAQARLTRMKAEADLRVQDLQAKINEIESGL